MIWSNMMITQITSMNFITKQTLSFITEDSRDNNYFCKFVNTILIIERYHNMAVGLQQNGRHSADYIFKCISMKENDRILIQFPIGLLVNIHLTIHNWHRRWLCAIRQAITLNNVDKNRHDVTKPQCVKIIHI